MTVYKTAITAEAMTDTRISKLIMIAKVPP